MQMHSVRYLRDRRNAYGILELMKQGGFTIVETMIVLAVTGILFVSAAALISGKQNKTEFQVAINDARQVFQQTINETASGYFPANSSGSAAFTCAAAGGGLSLTKSAVQDQGSNGDCVFLGKTIQFNQGSDQIRVYSVAGLSSVTNGAVANAKPTLVSPGVASPATWPDNSIPTSFENGLNVTSMYYTLNGAKISNVGGVAFLNNLGAQDVGGQLMTGTTQLQLIAVTGGIPSALGQSEPVFVDNFNQKFATFPTYEGGLKDVDICLASGTTNQSGLISIDAASLDVSLTIFGDTTC